jgi:hypothetical protein
MAGIGRKGKQLIAMAGTPGAGRSGASAGDFAGSTQYTGLTAGGYGNAPKPPTTVMSGANAPSPRRRKSTNLGPGKAPLGQGVV